jgi:hypothetical protein
MLIISLEVKGKNLKMYRRVGFFICGDGVVWISPIPCFFVVLVALLVWAVFWVVLGWGDGYKVCWMGWDRMRGYVAVTKLAVVLTIA